MRRLIYALATWLSNRTAPLDIAANSTERDDRAIIAVRQAYADCGLPLDAFASTTDLMKTGKLYDVMHRAATHMGVDHQLRTVGDVIDWLREAPKEAK